MNLFQEQWIISYSLLPHKPKGNLSLSFTFPFFNLIPKPCDFYAGSASYNDLLLLEILESPDKTDGSDSENSDESMKNIADFRIQLAMLEDIKDEALMGFRRQEDLRDSNL